MFLHELIYNLYVCRNWPLIKINKCCKSIFHFEFMIPNALTNANKFWIFNAIVKPSFCPLHSTNMATADHAGENDSPEERNYTFPWCIYRNWQSLSYRKMEFLLSKAPCAWWNGWSFHEYNVKGPALTFGDWYHVSNGNVSQWKWQMILTEPPSMGQNI